MPAVMRAAAVAEGTEIPSVAIGATGFDGLGKAVARSLGIPHVPIVAYPGVILTDTSQVFERKVRDVVAGEVTEALTRQMVSHELLDWEMPTEPGPRDIVFTGDLDEVQEYFIDRQWGDGLPVVPPTIERVERFLRWTDRRPDEVLGTLAPEGREATVWNVAVNGVMAGCRPEYLPILIAIVECLADPVFRIEDAGSTPGWEPLVILSGPLADDLEFNSGTGVMRVGRQANTSIGRFVRLYMRNVPGLRIPPGSTDQAGIGSGFNVVLAENGPATTALGWPAYGVERGYRAGESVVTVQSAVSVSAPIYSGGDRAEDHLETLTLFFANAMGPWAFTGVVQQAWYPLLVLGPSVARALADFGYSKAGIRRYLHEHALCSAATMERYAAQVGRTGFSLAQVTAEGSVPDIYAGSGDPQRLVPMFYRPEWIGLLVAGNPNRNQSRAYVNNHSQGVPVSRRIVLPARWDELRSESVRGRTHGYEHHHNQGE
jgi:hypothetical protein